MSARRTPLANRDFVSRSGAQHDDSPAKVQPLVSRRLCKLDEVAPSSTYGRCNRKRTLRGEPLPWQVPQRNEPSGLEQDAQAAVDLLTDRVKCAAKRVASMCDAVVRFRDARGTSKAEEALAMSQAVPLQKVSTAASKALEHARAEASAARLRFESSSRSRRIIDYVKGKWNAEFRPLDVEEAERRVEEAVRALNSARQEEDRAWDLVYEHYNDAEAVSLMLRRAQQAHTSAEHILADLKAALARAKHRAVRTAREVKDGRCLARKVYGNMGPLLVAARAAARSEDDSSGDQHLQQGAAQKTKRARY